MPSGLNIRRLIPQRDPNKSDDGLLVGSMESDDSAHFNAAMRPATMTPTTPQFPLAPPTPPKSQPHVRKDSWFSTRLSTSSRQQPLEPIQIGAPQSIHEIKSLPPLPNEPPRTDSPRSMRSWDHRQGANKRRSFSPFSVHSNSDQSEPSPQTSSATSYEEDQVSPTAECAPSSKKGMDFAVPVEEKAQAETNAEDEESPRQLRGQSSFQDFNDNVQSLIREADEAFKAIDTTLSEVKFHHESFDHDLFTSSSNLELPNSFNVTRPLSYYSISSPVESPSPSQKRRQRCPAAATKNAMARPGSMHSSNRHSANSQVSRSKSQKKIQERKKKSARKVAAAKHTARMTPRWPLAENVSDLFSGKIFQKAEVVEVLTPDQLEAFKMRRLSQLERQPIAVSEAGVPSRPLNRSTDSVVSNDEPSPNTLSFSNRSNEQINEPRLSSESIGSEASLTSVQETPMVDATRHQPHALDSIPEGVSSPILEEEPIPVIKAKKSNETLDDYVFLEAAPRTMNAPTIKHGSIRLNKSDLFPDPIVGADDGLDWTAFQMAILGGAGDWNSDSDEEQRKREAAEITDIIDWWSTWDNTSLGHLVSEDSVPGSPTSTISGDEDDFSYHDITQDNPWSAHQQQWDQKRRQTAALDARPYDITMAPYEVHELDNEELVDQFFTGLPPKTLHGEGDDYSSLPPSPMLDLRVIQNENGRDADVVPMGYNLGHDLGDFLRWEAEHAFAGSLYAQPGLA